MCIAVAPAGVCWLCVVSVVAWPVGHWPPGDTAGGGGGPRSSGEDLTAGEGEVKEGLRVCMGAAEVERGLV